MNAHTMENYTLLKNAIETEMPLLGISPLEATFVAWIDCRKLGLTDHEIEKFFVEDALIRADWGEEYGPGGSGFVRLNIATPKSWMEQVIENLYRAYERRGF